MADALMEEIIEEILLRLPPDDPASLLRAATVCRRWCRVISAPGFRRRFCQRHRTAPMLGFIANVGGDDEHGNASCVARFVPATPFRPPRTEHRDRRAVDARHGRVLLTDTLEDILVLEVWDPVTDELRGLPALPVPPPFNWNAAVVCAAHGACDHLDCRRGPFHVVFVDADTEKIRVHVYSSESATWSEPTYGPPCSECALEFSPAALVGNARYFMMDEGFCILEYHLGTQGVSMTRLQGWVEICNSDFAVLTTAGDGGLGFARMEDGILCFWSMETGPEGDVEWEEIRSIDLETRLPIDPSISVDVWFSIDKSGKVREHECGDGETQGVVPYTSFYTPDLHQYGVVPI